MDISIEKYSIIKWKWKKQNAYGPLILNNIYIHFNEFIPGLNEDEHCY